MTPKEIIAKLPYKYPFLFVDEIIAIDEDTVLGSYTFPNTLPFYDGHFENNPITPGVILIEAMAQIGVVCLGIYLSKDEELSNNNFQIAMTSSNVDYFVPVLPDERVTVKSQKEYFRFNKLKCKVEMYNDKEQLVCRGVIAGMVKY